jgi:hypothetical protein
MTSRSKTNVDQFTENADQHLGGFIDVFIAQNYRDRWRQRLANSVGRSDVLDTFERHLVESRCDLVEQHLVAGKLGESERERTGLFVDSSGQRLWITFADACEIASNTIDDSLFSIVPGALAVVFHHEGHCYLCRRS